MVVSYTVFLAYSLMLSVAKFLNVGVFLVVSYRRYPHALLGRQNLNVRKYQFKELALYAFQNLF